MALWNAVLAYPSPVETPWYFGIRVSEAMELLLVFVLFISTLLTVYFVQRWIGDY